MGIWQPLANQPTSNAETMLLLTDGTGMCSEFSTPNRNRLNPDSSGSSLLYLVHQRPLAHFGGHLGRVGVGGDIGDQVVALGLGEHLLPQRAWLL
jgi:hypothetical protein